MEYLTLLILILKLAAALVELINFIWRNTPPWPWLW